MKSYFGEKEGMGWWITGDFHFSLHLFWHTLFDIALVRYLFSFSFGGDEK